MAAGRRCWPAPGSTLDAAAPARCRGHRPAGARRRCATSCARAATPPDLALEAGTRYHLTTYGIWGFALASSPTVRDALAVGARFVDLSFTFCDVAVEEDDGELRLCLDDAALPERRARRSS